MPHSAHRQCWAIALRNLSMKRKSLVAYGHTQDLPASTLRNLLQSKPLPGPGLETIFQPRITYNAALFDSVRQMIRYEKSLSAWSTIVSDIDSKDVRNTLIMDYVYPVFRFLADIPNVFKDQLVRACVKLAAVSKGDYSLVSIDAVKDGAPRCDWYKELRKNCSDTSLGNQLITIINEDLFKHPDAKHFREFHGNTAHDLTPTLVSGVNQSYSVGDAVSIQSHTAPIELLNELTIIDRHRLRIQNAYVLFGDYATALQRDYESLLATKTTD